MKIYKRYFIIELSLAVLSSLILLFLTYFLDGSTGIQKIFSGINDQFKPTNYINIGILVFIGLCLSGANYFFNLSSKFILSKVSQGLLDIGINILRLAGGILISFPILYICFEGYTNTLIEFGFYGFAAVAEAALFSSIKDKIETKKNRKISQPHINGKLSA